VNTIDVKYAGGLMHISENMGYAGFVSGNWLIKAIYPA